jgi:acetyltransferase-like isoleucine patch superfamily enzyme
MFRTVIQVIAFFFPSPINGWIHKIAGAKIGKYVNIHPCVLILAKNIEIGDSAKIKFGTMINVRNFKLGKKSFIGFFTLVKGESDLIISDACMIGPKNMFNCSEDIIIDYYAGVGPGCYLYTHGSGMPVTEGYRATFAPIHIKEKVWVNMRSTIGPGVTIEEGTIVMPGTVLLESIKPKRIVVGNPAKLNNIPFFLKGVQSVPLEKLAIEMMNNYCNWSNEFNKTLWTVQDHSLEIKFRNKPCKITINTPGDIIFFTEKGRRSEGMYFNLADLSTDDHQNRYKLELESYLRLYYGCIFL